MTQQPQPEQDRESLEEKVAKHEIALFGFEGHGGLRRRVEKLEELWQSGQRAAILAAITVIIALLTMLVQLLVAGGA